MRLFVAIEIPDRIRSIVQGWAFKPVASAGWVDGVRYVRRENLHVTVKFFEEASEPQLPALSEALDSLQCGGSPLKLCLSAVECFPRRGPVATIALGLAGDTDRLVRFQEMLENACQGLGFPSERRAYIPHVTIARARPPLPSDTRQALRNALLPRRANQEFLIDEFVLMQSHLKPGGPEYIRLATFPLTKIDVEESR